MVNLFPNSCGYEVAAAWCPITDIQTIIVILIISITLGTLWSWIVYKKEKKQWEKQK